MLCDRLLAAGVVCVSIMLGACQSQTPAESPSLSQTLSQKGKTSYQSHCTACHHADPKKNGAIGPDIWGSSRELIEARILRAAYPAGYKPKRSSHAMAALPHLKNDIDALTAYLNAKE